MSKIFISYRREDSGGWAGRLADRLKQHFGHDQIFMDVDTLQPGADFDEAIKEAVGSCDVMLAVIGRGWLAAADAQGRRRLDDPEDFTRLEIATALERKVRVIPVLVNGAAMPAPEHLPQDLNRLARKQALELSDQRWNTDAQRLVDSIERHFRGTASSARDPTPGKGSTTASGAPDLRSSGVSSTASKAPEMALPPEAASGNADKAPGPKPVRSPAAGNGSRASDVNKWVLATVGLVMFGAALLMDIGSGFLSTIIIGFAVGLLAKALLPGHRGGGIIATGALGMAGALLAGFLGRALGWYAYPAEAPGIIVSIIGAMALLMARRLFVGGQGTAAL